MATVKLAIKESKLNKEGKVPIVLRITHNRRSTTVSMKKYIDPDHWDFTNKMLNKKHYNYSPINIKLRNEKRAYEKIIDDKLMKGESFTLNEIICIKKEIDNPVAKKELTVIDYMKTYIEENPENLGYNTLKNYKSALKRFSQYKPRLLLSDLTTKDIVNYEKFLRTEHNNKVNTIHSKVKCLKKLSRLALENNLLAEDPFKNHRLKTGKSQREYLTKEEIKQICDLQLLPGSHKLVRDTFIFCCYTGLRFSDVCTLKRSNIVQHGSKEGRHSINFQMQKTLETLSFLLPLKVDCSLP